MASFPGAASHTSPKSLNQGIHDMQEHPEHDTDSAPEPPFIEQHSEFYADHPDLARIQPSDGQDFVAFMRELRGGHGG